MRDKWIVFAGTALAVVSIVVLLSGAISPSPLATRVTNLETGMATLQTEMTNLKTDVANLKSHDLDGRLVGLNSRFDRAEQNILTLFREKAGTLEFNGLRHQVILNGSLLADAHRRIDETHEAVEAMEKLRQDFDRADELVKAHAGILKAIAREEGDTHVVVLEKPFLEIDNFHDEVKRVVNKSVQRESVQPKSYLTIVNNTGRRQEVMINEDSSWERILPGDILERWVPTGNICIRQEGQLPVHVTAGPPTYKLALEIKYY